MEEKKSPGYNIAIAVDSSEIDIAIEKANRLVETLREASTIIDSLAGRSISGEQMIDKITAALSRLPG